MWVEITSRDGDQFTGKLNNDPIFVYAFYGEQVRFTGDHIIDYQLGDETSLDGDSDHGDEAAAA